MIRLRQLREKKNLSQKEVAAYINKTFQAYSLYENGKRDPDTETLSMLADYFCVTTDYLLGRDALPPILGAIPVAGFITLPVISDVRAGLPTFAEDELLEYETIPSDWICGDANNYLILRITGDSMVDVGICEGYKVLIKIQNTCENGAIAVVCVNEDDCFEDNNNATLKRVFFDDDNIELVPENRKYPRMTFPAKRVSIRGIVKKVWFDL